jgi:hypothetical protein
MNEGWRYWAQQALNDDSNFETLFYARAISLRAGSPLQF